MTLNVSATYGSVAYESKLYIVISREVMSLNRDFSRIDIPFFSFPECPELSVQRPGKHKVL